MNQTTPQHIISTVVFTAAALCTVYLLTLSALLLVQLWKFNTVDKEVLTHMQSAGQALLGFLSGMLVNTRTPAQPVAESTQTVTTTTTDPAPTPLP